MLLIYVCALVPLADTNGILVILISSLNTDINNKKIDRCLQIDPRFLNVCSIVSYQTAGGLFTRAKSNRAYILNIERIKLYNGVCFESIFAHA